MKLADIIPLEVIVEAKNENDDIKKSPPENRTSPWLTTSQAARVLGVSMSRVRQFIMEKRLKSHSPEKGRRDNLLKATEVHAFKEKIRKITGRPEGT